MKSALDDALERLRHTGPEEAGGAPNHGPMAAEALVALGYDDAVPQWVDHYRRQLGPMPETVLPVTPQTWHDALGLHRRIGDWVVFFRRQLSAAPWQAVLTAWLPRLIPGVMAAWHPWPHSHRACRARPRGCRDPPPGGGTRHGARVLGRLLSGAAWRAAPHRHLRHRPGTRSAPPPRSRLRLACHPARFVRVLDTHPDFPRAVDALAAPETIAAALGALTEVGARLYLTNASRYPLIFLHAVTGPVALRRLLPHLSTAMQHTAFAYVWQAVAAWTAAFGSPDTITAWPDDVPPAAASAIIARSVDTRDPHAIKFAEACLEEYRLHPRPVYLRAALDWPTRLRAALRQRRAGRVAAGLVVRWEPAAQPRSESCEQTGRAGAQ